MEGILSGNQQNILNIISKGQVICDNFYLTGGTALAEFYLRHRLSEDFDFFSEKEFDPQSISIFFEKIKKEAKIKKKENWRFIYRQPFRYCGKQSFYNLPESQVARFYRLVFYFTKRQGLVARR